MANKEKDFNYGKYTGAISFSILGLLKSGYINTYKYLISKGVNKTPAATAVAITMIINQAIYMAIGFGIGAAIDYVVKKLKERKDIKDKNTLAKNIIADVKKNIKQ